MIGRCLVHPTFTCSTMLDPVEVNTPMVRWEWHKYLFGLKGPSGFGSGTTAQDIATVFADDVKDKVVMITGANTGLGKEMALAMAKNGATVIMACRSEEKMQSAITEIAMKLPSSRIFGLKMDLESLESVRTAVQEFRRLLLPLHILINNAGIMLVPWGTTKDSFERHIGVNHMGHFLLTNLLIEDLNKQPGGKVVNLASIAYAATYSEGIKLDKLKIKNDGEVDGEYNKLKAYGQSKLANLLHAKELNRRLIENDMPTRAYSCHPGVIHTNLFKETGLMGWLFMNLFSPILKNTAQGAATAMFCALSPKAEPGRFHCDCNPYYLLTQQSMDLDLAKQLWEKSAELTGSDIGPEMKSSKS
uniref:Protochlorophyllide reductase n=1 Tax=Fibrocapsa japonica TaxID=94617 RepID=A0A7S2UW49_9STRA